MVLLTLVSAWSANADSPGNLPRQDFWVADGPVYSVVETNGVLYLGGDFKSIAPNGGRGGLFNIFSGEGTPILPQVNGAILSVIPDGAGGWFVGGAFRQIAGLARTNLAHIRPDLTVDTNWNPNPIGFVDPTQRDGVYCLLQYGNVLYVGGIFTNIAGVARANLAALDLTTGALLPWNANVTGEVYCLASRSNALYFGGRFSAVQFIARSNIAAVDLATAGLLGWNPNATGGPDPTVNALVAGDDTLYVGGYFGQIGGAARNGLAGLDFVTGLASGWNPNVGNPSIGHGVQAIALTCDTVYFGGVFTNVGAVQRTNLAAVDAVSAQLRPWNPNPDLEVFTLLAAGNTVYAGGRFTTIGGGAHDSVAALDLNAGLASGWNPRADRGVTAMALVGDRIFLGGGLSAGGVARRNLAALDLATAQPLAWNPGADGIVRALAVTSNTVYLGGDFYFVNGLPRRCLAAINATNGQTLAWRADAGDPLGLLPSLADLSVSALAVGSSNTLYVGGLFTGLTNSIRACAGALDLTNAAVKSWAPAVYGPVYALAVASNSVYLGGYFTTIEYPLFSISYPRNFIAEVNATSGAPTSWNPSANDVVYALAATPTNVYAGGFFTFIGGTNRNAAAAINRTTGTATAWNPNLTGGLNPVVLSIAFSTNVAYLGGGFAFAGGAPRAGLAAVDLATGNTNSFDPQLGDLRATVFSVAARGSRLFCGGLFLSVGDEVRVALAEFVEDGYPRFTTQPAPQTVLPGEKIGLQAFAAGTPPLAYQWQLNGTNLAGATTNEFTIASANVTNSGVYRLIVTNGLGRVQSLDAVVTVLQAATITVQPVGKTNSPGSNIVLSVAAAGNPPPGYQWRLNGVNIPGAVSPSLSIPNAQPVNGGTYDVLVANHSSAVRSSNAIVRITSPSIPFANNFDNIVITSATNGLGSGNNSTSTGETGEPLHLGKTGGKSLWYKWTAVADGIATFSTRGSSFDTLLAVYTGTELTNLAFVAGDEDRGSFLASQVTFNAKAGTNYCIAVDGFGGRSGDIVMSWSLDPTSVQFPRILSQPVSQSVAVGQNATFGVVVSSPTTNTYQWYHACRAIAGATTSVLTLSNVQPRDVGEYTVVVTNASPQPARSFPAFLEISPVSQTLSQDKLADLLAGNVAPRVARGGIRPLSGSFPSVSAGTLGTQILNNYNATTEQGEPIHSDVAGGASRWYLLTAADAGVFLIDTIGSDIDTLLAVYTGTNIFTLNLVTNDNNSAPDRVRSRVQFSTADGTDYLVAVDGVSGAQGNIVLNWLLGTAPVPSGPPAGSFVQQGGAITLDACQTNTLPPPTYQWRLSGTNLVGATNCTLPLTGIQYAQRGAYSCVVSNFAGVVTNTNAIVTVEVPLTIARELSASNTVQLRVTGSATQTVVLRASTNLGTWTPVFTNANPDVLLDYIEQATGSNAGRFYRLYKP